MTNETKLKIKMTMKKRYLEGKLKIGIVGKMLPKEQKENIGKAHLGTKHNYPKNHIPWNKGKKMPEISGQNHPSYGKPHYWSMGEKNNHWKGGITGENRKQRNKFAREVRDLVFERDDYTCQLCGERGGYLHVDHIQPWAEYVEGRFDMNNCRTICVSCHYRITWRKEMPSNVKKWGQIILNGGGHYV